MIIFYFRVPASNSREGGIVVYVKNKYKYVASAVSKNMEHMIIWVRFKGSRDAFFCFAYCPTDNFPLKIQKFYDRLLADFLFYSRRGIVFNIADFNARLGKFTGDRSVGGVFVENNSKDLFLSFLAGISGEVVNTVHAFGIPTNTHSRSPRGGMSIIDFLVVKRCNLSCVKSFLVLSKTLQAVMVKVCHMIQ